MRARRFLPTLCAVVLSFWLGNLLANQQDDPAAGMMPAWMKLGKEHSDLAQSVGKYDVKGRLWMAPGTPPMDWSATSERKMILDGRFLEETMHADFMGTKFEGRMIQGYDTVAKEHFSMWLDSSTPMVSHSRGKMVDGILKMTGVAPDQATGKPKKNKSEVKVEGKTITMTMWDVLPDGKTNKTMEIVYTPAK